MRRIGIIGFALLFMMNVLAVTQKGNVRTIARRGHDGRPVGGVSIRVRGTHNASVSGIDGEFAILLHSLQNGDPYAIASIVKRGYEPAEQEIVGRRLPCSEKVPLEILLVKTSQLQREKEAIADKARKNVEAHYQKRIRELERQLSRGQITEADLRTQVQRLEQQYERFEPLIHTISDKFARTDYEQLDSITRLLENAIENGDLEETERLMYEKGGFDEREAFIHEQEQLIAAAQQVIDEAVAAQDERRAQTAKSKKELADDYFRMYSMFLSRFMNDSASYYIQRRAALDTLNVDYQLQAGQFVRDIMADNTLAKMYFERAYRLCELQYGEQSGQMATTCHELGMTHKVERRYEDALTWYQRSLVIRENIRGKDSPAVAEALNNLGELYRAKGDLAQAEQMHLQALRIREKHFAARSLEVAESKNNLAGVWFQQKQYAKAATAFEEVQRIYASLDKVPQRLVAANYNNLGGVSYALGKYAEAADYFEQAVAIYRRVLGDQHPSTQNALRNQAICKQKEEIHNNPL